MNYDYSFNRRDISNQLIHLTRHTAEKTALENLAAIINSSPPGLIGSNGFIKGSFNCVCFMETPLSEVANMLKTNASLVENEMRPRYEPFGIAVPKQWLWKKGGRPVIYQPGDDYDLLEDRIKYKHVKYEPPDIDFTWEREWRIKTDFLSLDPNCTTIIVNSQQDFYYLQQDHFETIKLYVSAIGEDALSVVEPYPWKVIALDAL